MRRRRRPKSLPHLKRTPSRLLCLFLATTVHGLIALVVFVFSPAFVPESPESVAVTLQPDSAGVAAQLSQETSETNHWEQQRRVQEPSSGRREAGAKTKAPTEPTPKPDSHVQQVKPELQSAPVPQTVPSPRAPEPPVPIGDQPTDRVPEPLPTQENPKTEETQQNQTDRSAQVTSDTQAAFTAWANQIGTALNQRLQRQTYQGRGGTVALLVRVSTQGSLVAHSVHKSSGSPQLDAFIQRTFAVGIPLPVGPETLPSGEYQIIVPVNVQETEPTRSSP